MKNRIEGRRDSPSDFHGRKIWETAQIRGAKVAVITRISAESRLRMVGEQDPKSLEEAGFLSNATFFQRQCVARGRFPDQRRPIHKLGNFAKIVLKGVDYRRSGH